MIIYFWRLSFAPPDNARLDNIIGLGNKRVHPVDDESEAVQDEGLSSPPAVKGGWLVSEPERTQPAPPPAAFSVSTGLSTRYTHKPCILYLEHIRVLTR